MVDGAIDPIYASGTSDQTNYDASGDNLGTIEGKISVVETADAFYIAFQQPFSAKSNAYCTSKGGNNKPGANQLGQPVDGCFQDFKALVGSDYLALDWANLGGKAIHLPMDIISASALTPNGYIGTILPTGRTTGEGGVLAGCPAGSVTGFSGMSYNWNEAGPSGWGAEASVDPEGDSPNFVGKQAQYGDYVYASTAEWKVDKAACGLTGVTAAQVAQGAQGDAHNSPAAPFTQVSEIISITCPGGLISTTVNTPVNVTATVVGNNNQPAANRPVVFFVASGPGTISAGATGNTNAQGQRTATASTPTAGAAGTTLLRAFLDLDSNGTWNPAVEPVTEPGCPFTATNVVVPTYTCVSGTTTGPNSATLVATTTDPAATQASFTTTPGSGTFAGTQGPAGTFTASATGLAANTDYTFTAVFKNAAGATLGTSTGTCPFRTGGTPDVQVSKTSSVTTVTAGGTVTFTITATNTGSAPAIDVSVGDEVPGSLNVTDARWSVTANGGGGARAGGCFLAAPPPTTSVSCPVGDLSANDNQAGGADTAVVTIVAQTTPASCPQVQNQATVSASNEPAANQGNNSSNIVTVAVTCPLSIDVVKDNDADGDGVFHDQETAAGAGLDVPFRAVITNPSPIPLVISSLTDVFPGQAAFNVCNNLIGTVLQPGASVTCNFTVSGYSPPLGSSKVDTVTVVGTDQQNPNRTVTDSDTSTVDSPPGEITVDVVKTNDADGDGAFNDSEQAPAAGATVPFQAVITNTSPVNVVITSITDLFPGQAEFGICAQLLNTVLTPGQSVTCSFDVQGYAPPAGGSLVDTVTVTVVDEQNPDRPAEDSDTSEVTTPEAPEITVDVVKTNDADGDGTFNDSEVAPAAGAAVPFRAVITNTSDVDVAITDLTDAFPGQAAFGVCADLIGTVLQPGGSVTCNFTVQGYAPATGGSLTDTVGVTVADVDNPGSTASDEDTSVVSTVEVLPLITVQVVKTNDADGDGTYNDSETAPAQGAAVPFRAVITNTSPVPVSITDLTDVFPGQAAFGVCAQLIGTVLQPDESVTCSFTVQGYAPAAGTSLVDTVRVDVVDVENPNNTANDSDDSNVNTPVPSNIDLAIDKDDAGATFTVGQTGTYTLVVTNVGTTATNGPITVTDTLPTGLTFNAASGTDWSCSNAGQVITCTYTAGSLAPGQVAPTITVTVNVGAAAVPQVINPARVSTPNDVNPDNDTDEEPTPVTQVFANPPIVRQTTQGPPTPPLVRTGAEAKSLAGLGALLVLFGAALVLATTRRRDDDDDDVLTESALVVEPAAVGFLPAPARSMGRAARMTAWAAPLASAVRASWVAAVEGGLPSLPGRPTGGWRRAFGLSDGGGVQFLPLPSS